MKARAVGCCHSCKVLYRWHRSLGQMKNAQCPKCLRWLEEPKATRDALIERGYWLTESVPRMVGVKAP